MQQASPVETALPPTRAPSVDGAANAGALLHERIVEAIDGERSFADAVPIAGETTPRPDRRRHR